MVGRLNQSRGVLCAAIACLCAAGTIGAQEGFEGLATVGRFGRFPAGLYGASNVVPPGTLVTVRNLSTARSERIVITDSVSEPGVFLILSVEAAALLDITVSGATRVRVTPVTDPASRIDPAREQPFSPDPDINPAAAVHLLGTLPPAAETAVVPAERPAEEPAAPEVEADEPFAATALAAAPEEPEVPEAPIGLEAPAVPVEPLPEAPAALIPTVRSGVAAGISRTVVGRAQESFEQPDAALAAGRPVDVPIATDEPAQPEAPEADRAVASIAPPTARVERPVELLIPPDVPPTRTADPAPPAVRTMEDGPIDDAIRAAVERLPRRDPFPAPTGDPGDAGLSGFPRPDEPLVATLPDVTPPAIDRPSLAGLAPLRPEPDVFDFVLSEASGPPRDVPDPAALAAAAPPRDDLTDSLLISAVPPARDVPTVADVGPIRPLPGEPEARLAEASVPETERPAATEFDRPDAPLPGEPEARLAEARPAPAAEAEAPVATVVDRPAEAPADTILTLEPADFRPPAVPRPEQPVLAREAAPEEPSPIGEIAQATDPEEEPAPVAITAPAEAAPVPAEPVTPVTAPRPALVTVALDRDAYYLQVGAFSTDDVARVAVDALGTTYPTAVLAADRAGRTVYRVVVGPIERDETGTLLVWLRSRGYRDTFVRTGAEL